MSQSKIYVGNLPFSASSDDIREAFAAHGAVTNVNVVMDRDTGRPRGFAFVEMASDADAQAAIRAMDGAQMGGRSLRVNLANERPQRSSAPRGRSW
jgi:RNA recognition motif-containing protein